MDRIIKVRYIGEDILVDLVPGKIYDCLEFSKGKGLDRYMRVIDDSGEDYLYPPEYFEIVA